MRKAEKIRAYIHQHGLQDHLVVPKKYLYWNAEQEQFYVVAEKMKLSSEVAAPGPEGESLKLFAAAGGQAKALADNARQRSLTPIQAKALAELSILGYTDLSYNNLYFTTDGKVAILDTEPVKRFFNKTATSSVFFFLFGDKGLLLTQQSIAGIAKLKLYTDNPDALRAVQKVERNHVLWRMAVLVTKISIVTLAICFNPTIMACVPIAAAAMTLKVGFIAFAALKNGRLAVNLLNVYEVWNLSCQGMNGLNKIVMMEMQGQL